MTLAPIDLRLVPRDILDAAIAERVEVLAAAKQKPVPIAPALRTPHPAQQTFIDSTAKRKVVRGGRRGGKTVGVAHIALQAFADGKRVLYATPTQDQIDRFWRECKRGLQTYIDDGTLYKNETQHIIERVGTENRIRAKTAWNADTLRGDYADLLIMDEYQLMSEDAWGLVGAPMLLDNNGDAVFVYTPPSLHSVSATKAKDPMHAAKLFKKAKADTSGRWAVFHFTSHDNPHISKIALSELTSDMSALAIRQEIDAEDLDEAPGALWKRVDIDRLRVTRHPDLVSVVTAVDPSASSAGDEAGIITAGKGLCSCKGTPELHGFVIGDSSLQGSPNAWARAAVTAYNVHSAGVLVAEKNNGGEMVSTTIETVEGAPFVSLVHASRGKATRAEPISAAYEQGRVHHVGEFAMLENEMCQWIPGAPSPNRMDALVWAFTELGFGVGGSLLFESDLNELAEQDAEFAKMLNGDDDE